MRLPKRISDILNRKQEFIDSQRDKLSNTVIKLQSQLFSDVVDNMVTELDIKDGMIVDNAKNYRLISVLDKTYKNFSKLSSIVMAGKIASDTKIILEMSNKYFASMVKFNFDTVVSKATKLINLKIGLVDDKIFKGGWLDSYFTNSPIGTELKQITSQAVTSGMAKREFIKVLKEKITGTTEYTGALERQFNMYAYDLYQQYDAAYNLTIGNELGMNYFIYQGGLIDDSRDFCAAHNSKVWSRQEAETWEDWVPNDGVYPEGWEVKAKDIYSHPGYMEIPGYDPFINRGGYHCRHAIGWISDDIAFDLRPDLTKN